MTKAEPLRALLFLLLEGNRVRDFACFLHETLNQSEDVLEITEKGLPTGP